AKRCCFTTSGIGSRASRYEERLERGGFDRYNVGIVYSDMDRFGRENVTSDMPVDVSLGEMTKRNVIHCASLVRREAIDLSQAFSIPADPKTEHEDWLLWLAVLRQGWKAKKQPAVYHYRRHEEGRSLAKAWAGNTYFERRGLRHETITLFIPLSGRTAVWPRFRQFLEQQTWPHDQVRLVMMDTGQDARFGRRIRRWIAECDYRDVRYLTESVAEAGLADQDRRADGVGDKVRLAAARIYNRLAREATGEFVWVIEDDVIPPNNAAELLMRGFDEHRERGKANNIVWRGPPSLENMTPFRDDNPACPADQKYKAVGGVQWITGGLWAFVSPDGIHWRKLGEKPLPLAGNFDSQNVAFWDAVRGEYRAYWRDHRRGDPDVPDGRDVRTAVSKDFITWSKRQWLKYDPSRSGATARDQTDDPSGDHHQFYTNGVQSYYRAPHLLLGFPQRYSDRGWTASTDALPGLDHRRKLAAKRAGGGRPTRDGTALTDVMLMASRDGQQFYVWPEAFVRPGIQRAGSWWYDGGCNWYVRGLVETRSPYEGAPPELSLYLTEKNNARGPARLRRHTLRLDGFASVHATLEGGQLVTRPLVFAGSRLEINFATSAAGSLRIEIQDENGQPIPGFELAECQLQYGDQLDRIVSWKSGPDVSKLAGKPIRLRVELKDANLYAMQFSQPK
ncbi:MAG: glycosyltransferase family A protein, partial [Fuerstiella sp.]